MLAADGVTALQAILAVSGWIAAGVTALVAEPLRQRFFRPRVKLEFDTTENCITPTPESEGPRGEQYRARFIRLRAVNTSPRIAKSCRAYLVKVERLAASRFEPTSYGDSLQLAWSALSDRSYAAIDLLENIPQYIDVISSRETSHTIHLHTQALPFRYEDLFFATTTYRVTVVVSGDGVSPGSIELLFDWNGRWDAFPVSISEDRRQLRPA